MEDRMFKKGDKAYEFDCLDPDHPREVTVAQVSSSGKVRLGGRKTFDYWAAGNSADNYRSRLVAPSDLPVVQRAAQIDVARRAAFRKFRNAIDDAERDVRYVDGGRHGVAVDASKKIAEALAAASAAYLATLADDAGVAREIREASPALPTFVESAAAYAQTGGPECATLTDEVDPTDSGAPAPSAE